MRIETLAIICAAALAPALAQAEAPQQPACATTDNALPAEMAGWSTKSDIASATDAKGLPKAQLAPGRAVTASLHHTRDVAYVTQPEKPGGTVAYGGLLELVVKDAGTYRIGLGSGAWIDVLQRAKSIQSTAHGHGPACSTIRKIVDFPLQPGRYAIQISANADPTVAIMAWRQP